MKKYIMLTKKQKKVWRIVRIIIILIIVYFVVVRPIILFTKLSHGISEVLPDTKEILPEYRSLLDSLSNSRLEANLTFNSRTRPSVSIGQYNKEYVLFLCKISSFRYPSIQTFLSKSGEPGMSSKVAYASVIDESIQSLIDFNVAISKKPKAKNIYLTIDGDSTRTIVSNDSLTLFYVNCRKASIKYSEDSINDIVISTKEDDLKKDELPMNLAFMKRHNSLYLIVMSPIHEGQQLSPDDLLKMLKK